MSVVVGVDFGTLSVRVSVVDSQKGRLGSGMAEYPVRRKREDPDYATQSHQDHMKALIEATRKALQSAGLAGDKVEALALDTTGSTVLPVAEGLTPLDDYYLWCDHRAWQEAAEITEAARRSKLEALDWCGGTYSPEWGFAKLLHWLRHNPQKRQQMATALEHCDMATAVLSGIVDADRIARSICAMGHKWMWNPSLGGLPSDNFLASVDPLLAGIRERLGGRYATSDQIAGHLSPEWAAKLGLRAGIPVPTGALDAHWDAIGAGIREGDVVNVVGTSTPIMAITSEVRLIPGVCGVVPGSIHPRKVGVEAGLAATGDIFEAIARRARTTVAALCKGLEKYKAGQTGLLRLAWDNGDRNILANPQLSGITLGWNLTHTAQDEFFAAMEGTAFHTRIILERMSEYGVPVRRVINGGGIPQKNEVLNRIYANVLNKPVLVPCTEVTSIGSAVFAFLAAGTFSSMEEAQAALCPNYRLIEPDPSAVAVYEKLFPLYQQVYFAMGQSGAASTKVGAVLSSLRQIAETARQEG